MPASGETVVSSCVGSGTVVSGSAVVVSSTGVVSEGSSPPEIFFIEGLIAQNQTSSPDRAKIPMTARTLIHPFFFSFLNIRNRISTIADRMIALNSATSAYQ